MVMVITAAAVAATSQYSSSAPPPQSHRLRRIASGFLLPQINHNPPPKPISQPRPSSRPLKTAPPPPPDSDAELQELIELLRWCRHLQHLKQIHARLIRLHLYLKIFLVTQLVSLYGSLNCINYGRRVFDAKNKKNVFLWNALIRGYSKSNHPHLAIGILSDMLRREFQPDEFTCPYVLKSCASITEGKQIHGFVWKLGLIENVFICSALIAMYDKFGSNDDARQVFDEMPERDVVCWNAIISGYVRADKPEKVLSMFKSMLEEDVTPTSVTMVNVLGACGDTGALIQGRWVHEFMIRNTVQMNIFVETALITMYSKCGDVAAAREVFDEAQHRDLVLWSAMMGGYGMNGCGEQALTLFNLMEDHSLTPDSITFVSLLSACSHAGLVDQCLQLFELMKNSYGIQPEIEHYACVVDLLGRSGRLQEAISLIERMRLKPGGSIWGAVLGACRVHGEVELAEKAAEKLFEVEADNAGNYVLLCNIYMENGRESDALRLRRRMRKRKIKKPPGCSLIEIGYRVHAFEAGTRSHPEGDEIYAVLDVLTVQAMEQGYRIDQ